MLAELKNYMRQYGPIHSCLILKDNGKSRGFGFITFGTHEVAVQVSNMRSHWLHGKEFGCSLILSNKAAKHKQIDKKNRKVYIKARDKVKLVEREMDELFSRYGEVEEVTILQESKERSGFILYATKEAVDRLLEAGDVPYKDTLIICEPCLSRKEIDKAKKTNLNTSRVISKGPYGENSILGKSAILSQAILSPHLKDKILEGSGHQPDPSVSKEDSSSVDQKRHELVPVAAGVGRDYKIKVTALENSKSGSGKDTAKKAKLNLNLMSEHGFEEDKQHNHGGHLMIPSVRGENMSHRGDAINSPQHSADEGKNFLLIPPHRDHYPAKRLSEDFNEKDAAAIAFLIPRSGSTKEIESKTSTLCPPQAMIQSNREQHSSKSREREGSLKSSKKAILSSKASSQTEKESREKEPLYKFHRSEQLGLPIGVIGSRRKSHNLEVESPSLMRRLSDSNPKISQIFNDSDYFLKDCDVKSSNQETRSNVDRAQD